tara:strand:- start:2136 stop:2603 length:468 start_codon:yes stop_codon:yes gene_type:complete
MRECKDATFSGASSNIQVSCSPGETNISNANIRINDVCDIDTARTAAFLLQSRAIRAEQFRHSDAEIDDNAWHILLDLMVSMKSNKIVTASDLVTTHDVAENIIYRYIEYLISVGMVERNIEAQDMQLMPLKLTKFGLALTTATVGQIGYELVNF